MTKTIPSNQRELQAYAQTVLAYVNANLAALGLVAADTATLSANVTASGTALGAHDTAANSARSARAAKDVAVSATEKSLRQLLRKVKANPALSDPQREGLGIGVPDRAATLTAMATAIPAFTRPVIAVDNSRKLVHELGFREQTTPDTRAKPDGVRGVQVWMCILPKDAPTPRDNQGMTFLAEPRKLSRTVEFALADAGKYAWYLARWTDLAGNPGDWSEPESRMIVA